MFVFIIREKALWTLDILVHLLFYTLWQIKQKQISYKENETQNIIGACSMRFMTATLKVSLKIELMFHELRSSINWIIEAWQCDKKTISLDTVSKIVLVPLLWFVCASFVVAEGPGCIDQGKLVAIEQSVCPWCQLLLFVFLIKLSLPDIVRNKSIITDIFADIFETQSLSY